MLLKSLPVYILKQLFCLYSPRFQRIIVKSYLIHPSEKISSERQKILLKDSKEEFVSLLTVCRCWRLYCCLHRMSLIRDPIQFLSFEIYSKKSGNHEESWVRCQECAQIASYVISVIVQTLVFFQQVNKCKSCISIA